MILFLIVLYCLGMIVTDNLLANTFIEGMNVEYKKRSEAEVYINDGLVRGILTIISIWVKIVVPLFWPLVWITSIILVLRECRHKT